MCILVHTQISEKGPLKLKIFAKIYISTTFYFFSSLGLLYLGNYKIIDLVKITVLSNVTPYECVGTNVSEEPTASTFWVE
jgi:hypothetical protein